MTKRSSQPISEEISKQLREIGLRVKQRRKQIEKNYMVFAEKKGINSMTLWRIENGENFSMVSFMEVLDALGVSLEEFFKSSSEDISEF